MYIYIYVHTHIYIHKHTHTHTVSCWFVFRGSPFLHLHFNTVLGLNNGDSLYSSTLRTVGNGAPCHRTCSRGEL